MFNFSMPLGEEGHIDNSQKGSDIKSSFFQQASCLEKVHKCYINVLGGQSNGLAPIMSHTCDSYIYLFLYHWLISGQIMDHIISYQIMDHIRSFQIMDHIRSFHIISWVISDHIRSYHIIDLHRSYRSLDQ